MSSADPSSQDAPAAAPTREFERYVLVASLTLLVLCLLWVDGRSQPAVTEGPESARLLRVEIGDRTGASTSRRADVPRTTRPVEPPSENLVPPPPVHDEPSTPPPAADPVRPEPVDPVTIEEPPRREPRLYKVKPRETLSGIASRELGSASRAAEIARLNGIDDPRLLRAGATIQLPSR